MSKRKIHFIYWAKLYCSVGLMKYGWKTWCGEFLWPWWKGTTEIEDVTCKKCQKIPHSISKYLNSKKRSQDSWNKYLAEELNIKAE